MQFKIQLTIMNPENGTENTKEIISLNKQSERLEDIGLSLAESKSILKALQEKITEHQCDDFVESNRACGACDKIYRKKGNYPIVLRTLFGDLSISSPRFYTCGCKEREHKTFSPLTGLLTGQRAEGFVFPFLASTSVKSWRGNREIAEKCSQYNRVVSFFSVNFVARPTGPVRFYKIIALVFRYFFLQSFQDAF